MRRAITWLFAGLLTLAFSAAANAQGGFGNTTGWVTTTCGTISPLFKSGNPGPFTVDVNGNLCINGTITSSAAPFAPGATYATLTATGSSADVALPAGAVVVLQNAGTTAVSCILSVGAGTATASKNIIQPSSTAGFTVGSNTHASCIDQTGSASNLVVLSGGAGLPAWAGGGGSGGGLAVTDNTAFTYGASQLTPIGGVYNSSITALTSGDQGAVALTANRSMHVLDDNSAAILSAIQGSIPAGSALIGKVGIDQTTPGTTNGVDPATIARWGLMSGTTPGTAPTNTQVIGGIYNSSAPSPTTGQTLPLQQDSSGNLNVNVKSATGVAIGSTTSGQTLSLTGCASTTYSPTATTADTWPFSCDPVGNVRIVPQASSGKVSGTNSQTSTTTTSLITAVTSERIYVQAISCSNTGSTTSLVLFQDGSGGTTLWQIEVPAGGGNNLASAAPMFWTTAGNALYFAPQSASTTVYCNASGYAGN